MVGGGGGRGCKKKMFGEKGGKLLICQTAVSFL